MSKELFYLSPGLLGIEGPSIKPADIGTVRRRLREWIDTINGLANPAGVDRANLIYYLLDDIKDAYEALIEVSRDGDPVFLRPMRNVEADQVVNVMATLEDAEECGNELTRQLAALLRFNLSGEEPEVEAREESETGELTVQREAEPERAAACELREEGQRRLAAALAVQPPKGSDSPKGHTVSDLLAEQAESLTSWMDEYVHRIDNLEKRFAEFTAKPRPANWRVPEHGNGIDTRGSA